MKKLLCGIFLMAAIFVLAACGSSRTIQLDKYTEISFNEPAYNGYTTPALHIDEDALNASVSPEIMQTFHKKAAVALLGGGSSLYDLIYIKLAEDYKNLKNGDTIEVVVLPEADLELCGITTLEQLEKELGVHFAAKRWSVKVKGLEEPTARTIDLQSLLTVDFGKYNGYATPTVSMDTTALSTLVSDAVFRSKLESVRAEESKILNTYEYASLFDVSFAKAYNNISNGDILRVVIAPNKELAALGYTMADLEEKLLIHFTAYEADYTVSGLIEAKNVIDLFNGIENCIRFRGPNKKGSATLALNEDYSFSSSDVYFNYIKYNFDSRALEIVYDNKSYGNVYYKLLAENEQLKEGDVITVTAEYNIDFFDQNDIVIASSTHDVIVPDLGEYLSEEDLASEETVNRLETNMLKGAEPSLTGAYTVIACHGLYFGTLNPGVKNAHDAKTVLVGVIETHDGWRGTQYKLTYLYDVVVAPGSISSRNKSDSGYESIDEALSRLNPDYTYSQIR